MPCRTARVGQEKKREEKNFSSQRHWKREVVQSDGVSDSISKVSRLSSSGLQPRGLTSGLEGTVACQDTSYIPCVVRAAFCGSL